jgi:medium-chain acyl-[acyl-carrier-protein] hydrolase
LIDTAHYVYRTDVAYSDVGPDGLLSQGGLLRILQEAAAIASDDVGYGLKDIPRTGVHWILSGWRLELVAHPAWRAALEVETWPRTMDGFLSDRDFLAWEVTPKGRRLAARGTSKWFLVDAETGKITRVTDQVRAAYELGDGILFQNPIPNNGKTPGDAPVTFRTVAGRRDIDTNLHVNNIHYLDYAVEALPEEVYRSLPDTVDIVFRRQILLGTPIQCLYARTGDGKHQVEIRSEQDGMVTHHAYVWFYQNNTKKEDNEP